MKVNTRKRRNARRVFEQLYGRQELIDRMYQITSKGKQGLVDIYREIGLVILKISAFHYFLTMVVSGKFLVTKRGHKI